MSEEKSPPIKIIKIDIFNVGEVFRENFVDKTFQIIEQGYEGTIRKEDFLEVPHDKARCLFRVERLDDFLILKSTIIYEQGYERKNDLEDILDRDLQLFDVSGSISSSLPSRLSTTFIIFVTATEDGEQAASLAEQYSDQISRSTKGVGIVRGCILSILESVTDEEEFRKRYFLSSLNSSARSGDSRIEEVLMGIELIAVYTAELSDLYSRSKNFFSVLEVGETEISERVEGYLWKLIEPEPVELETLESWLSYIMERESTVSAMTGNMKVSHMEARQIVLKVENIFKKLNERSFRDYPRNSQLEIDTYRSVAREFENFLVRSEALKSRLETVMEEVRTYLSLQQQKIAIEEQKSSKEQLVRLVNLQEIFHKVEIFIVAVYITEMAHIVFEVLFHDVANLLTAFFIPLALLLAIGISRILHREPHNH